MQPTLNSVTFVFQAQPLQAIMGLDLENKCQLTPKSVARSFRSSLAGLNRSLTKTGQRFRCNGQIGKTDGEMKTHRLT
jgi:hypothetical protein